MMDAEHFDQETTAWALEARRVVLAHGVACAIQERMPLSRAMDVPAFGCGTGLVPQALGPTPLRGCACFLDSITQPYSPPMS